MSLSVAYQFRSDNRKVAHDNLKKVLEACQTEKPKLENVLTNVSLEALNDYANAQLGWFHNVKKYSASVAAYGATVALPVGTVLGGSYYLFQDYIADPGKIPGDFLEMLKGAIPSVTQDFTDDPAGYYLNLLKGAVIATIVADLTLQKASGHSLLKPVAAWSASMLSTAWLYASYKAGEMTSGSYTKVEQKALETAAAAKKCILDQQMKVFSGDEKHFGISDELHEMYVESTDSPKSMFELKHKASVLNSGLPRLAKELLKAPLTASEVAQTFDKLRAVVKEIREHQFELRQGGRDTDNRYNSELMGILSENGIAALGIPVKVRQHIDKIKANTLGWGYAAGSVVDSVMKGGAVALAAGAALPVAAFAASKYAAPGAYPNIDNCIANTGGCLEAKLIAGAGVVIGAGAGYRKAASVYREHKEEMRRAAELVEQHTERAEEKLMGLCDGIADHLSGQAKNRKKFAEVKDQALAIKEKLPAIGKLMLATDVVLDTDEILGRLRDTISKIESSETRSGIARAA